MSVPDSKPYTPQIFRRSAGKTVLVTGAGTGFGAEIAFRAAQEGAKVAVHYRSFIAGAEKTVARIEAIGGEAIVVQADIGSWAAALPKCISSARTQQYRTIAMGISMHR